MLAMTTGYPGERGSFLPKEDVRVYTITLAGAEAKALYAQARERGMSPLELLRRALVEAGVR